MSQRTSRRRFLQESLTLAAGCASMSLMSPHAMSQARSAALPALPFSISLAEWSLHKTMFAGKLDNLDFAKTAKASLGIEAVEYVNQFFKDKAEDSAYLAELERRASDQGVQSLLIMVDGEGALGDADPAQRQKAVENHYKWVTAAKRLGCHSIRVNAQSSGSEEEQLERAADGLRKLSEFAADHGLNVLVENHGGLSSNGRWLANVMKKVALPNCGTLPDFGNFRLQDGTSYDRYQGVAELMPFAKAVSAKSHDFDEEGNEIHTDYRRMMRIVLQAGYTGFVGIEYEGQELDELAGIEKTKQLLERVREELMLARS